MQIFKSCILVFFIFISIAWLMQISRLFAFLNNLQINFLEIFFLSSFLIPNIITIIMPFVIIFGLVLSFIKFDKDKEIIAMFSLGIPIAEVKKPIFILSSLIVLFYLSLNLLISPYIYEKYKDKEFKIRNTIDLESINLTNFIEINDNVILDFKKENNQFLDIFINYEENGENIIFAEKGFIENKGNKFIFNLMNGYKLNILESTIENLKFEEYKLEFDNDNNSRKYKIFDKNSQTIFNLIKDKNYRSISEKIIDSLLLILIIVFFYEFIVKNNNFNLKKILIFIVFSILVNVNNNLIKNIETDIEILALINLGNILLLLFIITYFKFKKYE